jgi:hypothetical protein
MINEKKIVWNEWIVINKLFHPKTLKEYKANGFMKMYSYKPFLVHSFIHSPSILQLFIYFVNFHTLDNLSS